MHSNDVLMPFTDWFQSHFPAKQPSNAVPSVNLNNLPSQRAPEQLSDRLGDSGAHLQSYAERRHQKKESNLSKAKQSEIEQREKIE